MFGDDKEKWAVNKLVRKSEHRADKRGAPCGGQLVSVS